MTPKKNNRKNYCLFDVNYIKVIIYPRYSIVYSYIVKCIPIAGVPQAQVYLISGPSLDNLTYLHAGWWGHCERVKIFLIVITDR